MNTVAAWLPVHPLDLAIVLIILVSAVFAYFRGFVREVLAVMGWLGAIIATLYLFQPLSPFARRYIHSELFADLTTGVVIFIVSLVILSLISQSLSNKVQRSRLSSVDRILGFFFGVARGVVVILIAYLLAATIVPPSKQPSWVHQAKLVPLVRDGGVLIVHMLPGIKAIGNDAFNRESSLTSPNLAPSSQAKIVPPPVYKGAERRALDNLILNSGGQ